MRYKIADLPLPMVQLDELFTYVEERLCKTECDNTHRHTIAFLRKQEIRKTPVMEWLFQTGGCCCDCEVMLNSYWHFFEICDADPRLREILGRRLAEKESRKLV